MQYYLAIDIGASSGRHILGSMQDGKIVLEEVYRFGNGMEEKNGHLCWNHEKLFAEIITGMRKCKETGKVPASVGIDTWGVDFVLLDENDRVIGDAVGYRDSRTDGMDEKLYADVITEDALYERTGIQKAIYNTIYQLYAIKQQNPEQIEAARTFLMTPNYFNFLLCGKKLNEYTLATTTQLVDPETKDWDKELLAMIGVDASIMAPVAMPKTVVGEVTDAIRREIGYSCKVVLPGCHDTASAVLSVPAEDDDFLYISSGTWSLMGIERSKADCSPKSRKANFTNEGGFDYRFRYLKNIMGLWMIQSVKKELQDKYSFAELCELAKRETEPAVRINVDDARFLAPDNMTEAIQQYCEEQKSRIPQTPGELAACIYNSLADAYADVVDEIEGLMGKTYGRIHIVGGGSNAGYLNQLTANATKKPVYAGPAEATAIGNIVAQMIRTGEFSSMTEARKTIFESFGVKEFLPA